MSKRFLKIIGNNVRFLRKDKSLSQEKLAELIGYSRNYVGMIERAETNPSINTLCNIAKVLDVKPEKIFTID